MEKSNKKGLIALIVILLLIIIGLVCYIVCKENTKNTVANAGTNKGVLVLDDAEIKDEYSPRLVLKIKNTSDKPIIDVTPTIIYRDVNNMPFHEAWGTRIRYFAPGDERCVEFYDTIQDYDNLEIGMMDGDEEKVQYKDMRDQVTFETELAKEPDEDGEYKMYFKGENKSDKDLDLEFQIEYYDGDKLIYEDQFITSVDGNGTIDEYEYYATKFENGTKFPEGYTYKAKLTEAVEFISDSDDYEDLLVIDGSEMEGLNDEDKVEHAVFEKLTDIYGDQYQSAKIYVDKMYKKGDKELEDINIELEEGDIAFEVTMYIEPAEGADPNLFTIPNGEYDEESGYVRDVTRVGILRVLDEDYCVASYGTGW